MLIGILKRIFWLIAWALRSTLRFRVEGEHHRLAAKAAHPQGSYLVALWHEQLYAVLSYHAWTHPYLALASRSKDGDLAAYLIERYGFVPVRGSSSKNGKDKGGRAAIQMYIEYVAKGHCGGITVDGPKGPRYTCKPGVAMIARESGAWIVPCTAKLSSYWQFNSWDRFKLPKPFSTVTVIYGAPFKVGPAATEDEIADACRAVERGIHALPGTT